MVQIPEELLTRLDALAETVGASGAQLIWETLVVAGFVKGVISVIFVLFCFSIMYGSIILGKWGVAWNKEKYSSETGIIAIVAAAVGLLSGIVGTVENIANLIYLFVPEYYAVERLVELLN